MKRQRPKKPRRPLKWNLKVLLPGGPKLKEKAA